MERRLEKFRMYNCLSYFLPGSMILLALYHQFFEYMSFISANSFILVIYFIVLSYSVGMINYEVSELIEKYIFPFIWGGLPSERFLTDKDKKYSAEYKKQIKNKISEKLKIETDSDKKKRQEAFCLIYSKGISGEGHEKIQLFKSIYEMNRNFLTSILTCILFVKLSFLEELYQRGWFSENILDVAHYLFHQEAFQAMIILLIILLVHRRTKRFAEKFIDYVYRDFMNM